MSSSGGVSAIILAGGSGNRFGGRKQFVEIRGRRLVDRVVEGAGQVCDDVVVVLPADVSWDGPPVTAAVAGGPTRSASVRSGLAAIPSATRIVLIHDPAHPLVSRTLMEAVIEAVRRGADAALPAVPIVEPLKRVEGTRVLRTVPRDGVVMVQGPHAFPADVLRTAYAEQVPDALEDTMLVEAMGGTIVVVPGDPRNIHLTTPEDLEMVARLLDDEDGQ